MTSSPSTGEAVPVPLHRRSIEYEAFEADGDLSIVGRLRDTRPWAADGSAVERVHDMELRVTVQVADLTITDAEAVMHTFPHVECPAVVAAFRRLTGLSVARGYTREVRSVFGGRHGCTHLEHLARSLGPVAIQAVTSRRALAQARGHSGELFTEASASWARNSCHVWAEGGIGEQKLAAGWRPGAGPYPTPSAVTFRTRDA